MPYALHLIIQSSPVDLLHVDAFDDCEADESALSCAAPALVRSLSASTTSTGRVGILVEQEGHIGASSSEARCMSARPSAPHGQS